VSCTLVARAEACDRAVDGRISRALRPDPEPLGNSRPEAFEHDVGAFAKCGPELRIALAIPDERLLAGIERGVPAGCCRAQRIASRRFDAHDAGSKPKQLTACERPRQVAREIRDQDPRKWLHYAA
jgi:hypothetical protein